MNEQSNNTEDRQIVNSRVINAPRELVWKAWTDPNQLVHWWGPAGFTNTFNEIDIKPGGNWRFVMHGPDGKDYPNESVFGEIVKPERIIINHISAPIFQMTATFEDVNGKTKLTWLMLFETVAVCDAVRKFAPAANEQNLDRLEAQLTKMASGVQST